MTDWQTDRQTDRKTSHVSMYRVTVHPWTSRR